MEENYKFDVKESCNRCGERNEIKQVDVENGVIYECETNCKSCGFEDYWAFGFFQSGQSGFNESAKY